MCAVAYLHRLHWLDGLFLGKIAARTGFAGHAREIGVRTIASNPTKVRWSGLNGFQELGLQGDVNAPERTHHRCNATPSQHMLIVRRTVGHKFNAMRTNGDEKLA
jgi:hypothetical protein